MQRAILSNYEFSGGFQTPVNELNGPVGALAEGSRNQIYLANGLVPWKGMNSQGASTGSRLMKQVLGTWGGLQDYVSGMTTIEGKGSIFGDIGKSSAIVPEHTITTNVTVGVYESFAFREIRILMHGVIE